MKSQLLYIQSSKEPWFLEATELYHKKINGFFPFEIKALKAKGIERAQSEQKKKQESDLLLKHIEVSDYIILFDEKGRVFKDSIDFSKHLNTGLESGKQTIKFVIGGAYGSSELLQQRANLKASLSPLTMNHLVATVAALEQVYRGLTILKKIPYHNS